MQFRSKAVILSQGGKQELHPEFYNWFPKLKQRSDRVMLSDFVLKRQNFKSVVDFINANKVKKIVIVGGSHSGFSVAWMLMNGPADFKVNNSQVRNPAKFPEAQRKERKDCSACCHCSID